MKIKFHFCGDEIEINCDDLNKKFRDILKGYCDITNLKIHEIYILYNGTYLDINSDKTIGEILNRFDKQNNSATMLVFKNDMNNNELNYAPNPNIKISQKNDKAKDLINPNSNQQINYENTDNQMNINNQDNKNNYLNINNQKNLVIVNFKYKDIYHLLKASKQTQIRAVCAKFAADEGSNVSWFNFIYKGNIIDQNKTVADYYDNNNNDGGITIYVEDNEPCYKKHQTKLIAAGVIIFGIILLTVIIIVYNVNKNKKK